MNHLTRPIAAASALLLVAGTAAAVHPTAASAISIFTVSTVADAGPGSLRAAITAANAAPADSVIEFSVGGTISLASSLPALTRDTFVDGTSAPGYTAGGAPVVQIDNEGHAGLTLADGSAGSQLLALSITDASGNGVTVQSDGVLLDGNYIGVAPDGSAAGNDGHGVEITSGVRGTQVGQNTAGVSGAVSNVISANAGSGVMIRGGSRNVIQANYIGTDPAGAVALANGGDGITLLDRAKRNTIGGRVYTDSATGEQNNPTGSEGSVDPVFVVPPLGNLVSGNSGNGIAIKAGSESNVLNGNFVGTVAGGDDGLGNGANGVLIRNSDDNVLQGCRLRNNPFVYYNVLSDNARNGLRVSNSDGTVVQANFFGVGADNTTLLGNGRDGLRVDGDSADTQVGGVIPLGNVIAGNNRNGIALMGTASGFTSFNTFAGLLAFKGAAPNGGNGIHITATGGDNLLRTNVVSGNDGNGVELAGRATGVTIDPNIIGLNTRGDGILANGGHGIVITDKAHHNTIGGRRQSVIRQNTVSGNDGYGLVVNGKAHHNRVFNTFIGSDIQGNDKGKKLTRVGNGLGGVLMAGKARDNILGYGSTSTRDNKLISGNDGPGVTLRKGTQRNTVVRNYIGLGRHGRCLVNEGRNIIDRGRTNDVRANLTCSPS